MNESLFNPGTPGGGYDSARHKSQTAIQGKKRNNGGMSAFTESCNNDLSMMITNFDQFTSRAKLRASAM